MNVVWHQAISVEIEGQFGFLRLDEARELKVIIVGPENLSTIIPASDYVVEPSSDFDPWFPRHGGADTIVGIVQMSTKSSLTPPCAVPTRRSHMIFKDYAPFPHDFQGLEAYIPNNAFITYSQKYNASE